MRNHHAHHHHHALAHAAHRHLVQHAPPSGPGGAWYVRAIESFSHFSVGWLLGGAGYLLGRLWLPAGLIAAGALAVLAGRVWGRHRLAAAGSRWELRPGEQMSRAALEAFTRTLAGGLIACRILHDARELPAATATTLPPLRPTQGDTAGAIHERARDRASERRAVEETIRERYGRIEQPPPGRAQADELDSEVSGPRRSTGAPLDAPFDAPCAVSYSPRWSTAPPPAPRPSCKP